MPRRRRSPLLAVLVLITATPAAGQSSTLPPPLSVPYVHHVPAIEDFLRAQDDPGAHTAGMAMVDRLIQRAPHDGAPVSERTRVYIGYDNENVYAAFVCFDSDPAAVRGQLAARERMADDDDNVALQLDTFGDRKHAYTFQVSAAGVQRDGIWTESAAAWDFSFDAIWQAESRRTSHGYVVLITVPLRSLRFPARAEQSWGVFFFREMPRKGELAFWPAYSPRIAGRLTQAGTLVGIRGVLPNRNLQLTPYTTAQAVDSLSTRMSVRRPEAGLDAKWVVRNSTVLDVAINPDFSQVETDEPQVTVNERFEKLFPEKRPFFLENAGYFQMPIALLFTRRVVDPQVGIRVTGKRGPYAVAALVIDDQAPDDARSGRAIIAAARTTRNVGREGLVGTFVSTREHGAHANRVAGIDGRFALGPNWTGVWQAVASTSTADGRLLAAGPAYAAAVTRSGRSLTYTAAWHDRSAGFRAATGYVPRSDFRSWDQTLAYRFRPAGGRLVAWGPDLAVTRVWDRAGARLDSAVTQQLTFEWTGPVRLALAHTAAQQRLRPGEGAPVTEPLDTDADRIGVDVTFSRFRRLVWTTAISRGAAVNLRPLAGLPPDPADDLEARVTASARIARGATVDATVLSRRLAGRRSDAAILQNHIWRVKATYQFTAQLGLRAIVQRDTLAADSALTALSPYRDDIMDVLITYMAAPGRALFIGATRYDDRHSLRPAGRGWQLFTKMSYAFQL